MNVFDFDGVTSLGLNPGPNDVIITGRPIDQAHHVLDYLSRRGIRCPVYFNPTTEANRGTGTDASRLSSALHKATTIVQLLKGQVVIGFIFEDDLDQISAMKTHWASIGFDWLADNIVHINHNGKVSY